jgi:hypothetical protein
VFRIGLGIAALFCVASSATPVEMLVGSARREGGRVLVCRHFARLRIVERQYLDPARGMDQQACPIIRFG